MRPRTRVRTLCVIATLAAGCADTSAPPDAARADAAPPARPRDLDLLLAVDGSSSVGEEQWSFIQALPALLAALTSGDADGDGVPEARGFDTIQIGVVTSDMGVGGHAVPSCEPADFGEDGVLRDRGDTERPGCMTSYPRVLGWGPGTDLEQVAASARCVARVGTTGCGFEQPLEGVLKAISPSAPTASTPPDYAPPTFLRGTTGHGDGVNEGFLRQGSLLAVLLMTDEDDCSARDADIYREDSEAYAHVDLLRRCDLDDALHPIARYLTGLIALRPHPSRVAFFPIAGMSPTGNDEAWSSRTKSVLRRPLPNAGELTKSASNSWSATSSSMGARHANSAASFCTSADSSWKASRSNRRHSVL